MIYSLAEDDWTFFEEGHLRAAADVALMVMDNAGYQAAFGDHLWLTSSVGIPSVLQLAGWYYRSPGFLWGADLAGRSIRGFLGQTYNSNLRPEPPQEHVGLRVAHLPSESYEFAKSGSWGPGPNLPLEQVFDKLSLRGGWNRDDEYLLIDGHGRGYHMHFDVNAIISYAVGGCPLLVDGEYIKSLPKYHNSLVIVRNGAAEPAPAVAGLGRAEDFGPAACARTWVTGYSGARWTRTLLWQRGDYLLVRDEVQAEQAGQYTLRCCWRPWGEATLRDGRLDVQHPPMRLTLVNADGAPSTLETMKTVADLPISRLSQQVSLNLKPGQTYCFVNLLRAEPLDRNTPLAARPVAADAWVVQRGDRRDLVAFTPGDDRLSGLKTDAEAIAISDNRLLAVGCSRLECGQEILRAEAPISLEIDFASQTGKLIAGAATRLTLRTSPGCRLRLGEQESRADESGSVSLSVPVGNTAIKFSDAAPPARLVDAQRQWVGLPAIAAQSTVAKPVGRALPVAWRVAGMEPPQERLPIKALQASVPPSSTYRLENLIDGKQSGSVDSAGWAPANRVEITLELAEETDVRRVALYEWQGNPSWGIGSREVQLSSDGFQKDIRSPAVSFVAAGRVGSSGSENVRMEAALGQKARQVRIKLAPASAKTHCYLSEIELLGIPQGKHVPLNAIACGDLDGDGTDDIVVAGESGRIMAVSTKGETRWNYDTEGGDPLDALACADVDGDGHCEVLFGGRGERLGLLGGDGQFRWQVKPQRFSDTASDVKTVFPGDVDGDGRPEVLCGCASCQYFAYDARGQMLWSSVIYAHSATVGCAKDLDGDGKEETIAGNAYYQLNVLRPNGRRLWTGSTITPEMTAVGAGNIDSDSTPKILCGMDGGDLICFDTKGKKLWRVNLGDKITRIALVDLNGDRIDEVICSSQSAQIVALNGKGKTLWRTALPGGADDLAVAGSKNRPKLAVAAGPGGLLVLDNTGKIVGEAKPASSVRLVAVSGRLAVVTCDDGSLQAVTIPDD
jgi:hypothetical protein